MKTNNEMRPEYQREGVGDGARGKHYEAYRSKRDLLDRISVDPNVCFGKPSVRGHRIRVSLILDMLAAGMSFQEILDDYPGVTDDDIRACIAYGSEMSERPDSLQ